MIAWFPRGDEALGCMAKTLLLLCIGAIELFLVRSLTWVASNEAEWPWWAVFAGVLLLASLVVMFAYHARRVWQLQRLSDLG